MQSDIFELGGLLYNYRRRPGDLRALQDRRLRALVRHAYENVPYYRTLFQSAGLTPQDIQTVQDLARIPITTKNTLRSLPLEQYVAAGTDVKACIARKTSGTTGEPFAVYFSPMEFRTRQIVDFRAMLVMGVRPRDRMVILGPQFKRTTRWPDRLGLYRTRLVSSTLDVDAQIQALRELQPTALWAYAHVLEALVDELHGHLSSLIRPRILITSAYNLSDRASRILRADLGAEMFNFYGSMEVGRIAHECPAHRGLHVNSDRLILESVPDETITSASGVGSAIVTALDFYTMPFIRYCLGDLVSFSGQRCICGSNFPLIGPPQGREFDLFVLPSGRRSGLTWLAMLFNKTEGIERYQVIQERPDRVLVKLSLANEPAPGSLDDLKCQIAQGFQEPIEIDIQLADIVTEPGVKFKAFVSKVNGADKEP